MQRQPHAGMALERVDHGRVRLVEDLGEDPAEVPDRLVIVQGERQRDPRWQGRQPASVTTGRATVTGDSTPAAGRYRRSV